MPRKAKVGDHVRVTAPWATNGTYWHNREARIVCIAWSFAKQVYGVCTCGVRPERQQTTLLYRNEFELLEDCF